MASPGVTSGSPRSMTHASTDRTALATTQSVTIRRMGFDSATLQVCSSTDPARRALAISRAARTTLTTAASVVFAAAVRRHARAGTREEGEEEAAGLRVRHIQVGWCKSVGWCFGWTNKRAGALKDGTAPNFKAYKIDYRVDSSGTRDRQKAPVSVPISLP